MVAATHSDSANPPPPPSPPTPSFLSSSLLLKTNHFRDLLQLTSAWKTVTSHIDPTHHHASSPLDLTHPSSPLSLAFATLSRHENNAAASSKSKDLPSPLRSMFVRWYLNACRDAFDSVCAGCFSNLDPSSYPDAEQDTQNPEDHDRPTKSILSSEKVPLVLQHLVETMSTWERWLHIEGPMNCSFAVPSFREQFRIQVHSKFTATVISSLQLFLARNVLRSSDEVGKDAGFDQVIGVARNANLLGLSKTLLSLLSTVLRQKIIRKVRFAVEGQGHDDQGEGVAYELEEESLTPLRNWLHTDVTRCFKSVAEAARKPPRLPSPDPAGEEDMAVDNVQSSTPSKDTWEERLEFYLYETLCRSRAKQLFDLIATFPDSIRALGDLRICLEKTDEKLMVARELSSSLRSRLLHPGAHTRDIIQLYVHMVRSLREIDPSGIILSRVVSPLRKYLRSRKDTISVVVSSLLGDDPNFTLLRDELEDQDEADEDTSRASANRRNFQHHPSAADPRGREEEEEEDEDWLDSTWVPRPVDAGPNYRMSRSKDVIGMLVSVFNDKEGFVAALEKSMSEQLIRVKNYDAMKEYRNNMILKKRFGETSLGRCDVMLGDIADSRRINNLIQSTISTTDLSKPTYRTSNRSREEEERKGAASLDELPESFSKLRPIIISRQFWPDLTKSSKSNDPSFSGGSRLGWIQREEDDDDDEDEDEIEEDGRGLPRHLSRDLKRSLEIYGRSFNQKKSMRRLKWFKRLMRVEIEIESESGSKVSVECRPFQANVLEVATGLGKGGDDGGEAPPFSIEMVSEGISRSCRDDDDGNEGERSSSSGPKLEKVLKALRFWCRKGLLAESNVSPGLFRLVEFKDHAEVEDVEM